MSKTYSTPLSKTQILNAIAIDIVIVFVGNAIAIVIGEGAVENLPVVDDAVAVAVGGEFDEVGGNVGGIELDVVPLD